MHEPDQNPSDVVHYPVLYEAVLQTLKPKEGDIVMDCTLGRGGHAALIMPKLGTTGRYIGVDCDDEAIGFCKKKFGLEPGSSPTVTPPKCQMDIVKSNVSRGRHVLKKLGLKERGVDIFLADLGLLVFPLFYSRCSIYSGISSVQLADPERGISFQLDGPLDMRLDPSLPNTAADLVNQLSEEELAAIIFYFGEEKLSRRIARAIVDEREMNGGNPILTTSHLLRVVTNAIPPKGFLLFFLLFSLFTFFPADSYLSFFITVFFPPYF